MKTLRCLLPILLFVAACGQTSPTVSLLDTFLHKLDENPEEAYAMASQDFKSETTLEELEAFRDAYPEIKNFKRIKQPEISEDQGFTTLTGTLITTTGEEKDFESLWIQKKGDWWLVHFELK